MRKAVEIGDVDTAEFILEQGVDPNECDLDSNRYTDSAYAYDACIYFGAFDFDEGCIDKDMVKLLLDYGAKHDSVITALQEDELFEFLNEFELIINDWATGKVKACE